MVHDVDRPDVNGVPPKMLEIRNKVAAELAGLLPYLAVGTNDNLMSSVEVRGTREPREAWANGIFHNATYFILFIKPMDGKRYYDPADPKVTAELTSVSPRSLKFRKYTAPVDKVIAKVKAFIKEVSGPAA